MKSMENIQTWLDTQFERISEQLDQMTTRERVMVIFTTIFVLVVAIGSAVWFTHRAAEKQLQRLNELKDTLSWMQTNVVRIKPNDGVVQTTAEKIQLVAQQQGLSVGSQQVAQSTVVVAQHENYAVLANFLTQMAQVGLSIEKMQLVKEGVQIKLTATVR